MPLRKAHMRSPSILHLRFASLSIHVRSPQAERLAFPRDRSSPAARGLLPRRVLASRALRRAAAVRCGVRYELLRRLDELGEGGGDSGKGSRGIRGDVVRGYRAAEALPVLSEDGSVAGAGVHGAAGARDASGERSSEL